MAAAYSRWQVQGAAFHYVSAGPWQLYGDLEEFRQAEGFPAGSFHMKLFRVKDSSFFDLFADADRTKLAAIEPLFETFPQRRFVLVGDSGERDPEIYGDLARRYPDLVRAIFIRDVTGEERTAPRYGDAYRGCPEEKWQGSGGVFGRGASHAHGWRRRTVTSRPNCVIPN
jgi:phosphatidate phosphatase APP1